MDAKQMLRSASTVLKQLRQLDALCDHIPKKDAATFISRSIADVRELMHVAKFETQINVTAEQATHITKISNRVMSFMRMIPDDVKKDLDSGKETA